MRSYPEIARIIGLALIRSEGEKGFNHLSGFIQALRRTKAPASMVQLYMRTRDMKAEGCSDFDILAETGLHDADVLAQNMIDNWQYAEEFDFEGLIDKFEAVNDQFELDITLEEFLLYVLVNTTTALKIKMLE